MILLDIRGITIPYTIKKKKEIKKIHELKRTKEINVIEAYLDTDPNYLTLSEILTDSKQKLENLRRRKIERLHEYLHKFYYFEHVTYNLAVVPNAAIIDEFNIPNANYSYTNSDNSIVKNVPNYNQTNNSSSAKRQINQNQMNHKTIMCQKFRIWDLIKQTLDTKQLIESDMNEDNCIDNTELEKEL
ncbi:hypothetical protein LOTGIDRAFT_175385 [Lottia gigantea]|uniref:EF-hand domain-containing protein n=1 Tax=Lottia gigantea TaxID=225164 RepID=V4AHH1_LOTGI|nr:hypothetical protein LOTGIDRAFT_175385 [Lottia gigantea]ESO94645.1 hypothetical protein LOTGIDRAFT_175385 [Lottia gigantea]